MQAPRSWFTKLSETIVQFGFQTTKSDNSLFAKFYAKSSILILIYVDDIIITRTNNSLINSLIESLSSHFSLKDLISLHYFLGIEVLWTI